MNKIQLIPLKGIVISGKTEINFGLKRKEVENILGKPDSVDIEKSYYEGLAVRFDFDKKGKLEFIEFIDGPFSDKVELSIYDINPFVTDAKELVKLLLLKGNNNVDDSEAEISYVFPDISVGVWRDYTEKDIVAEIEELKKNGEYEKSKEWIEHDMLKSEYFWTIGIGIKDYYNI
jgi:hypothetical protein